MQLFQRRKKGRSHLARREQAANSLLIDSLDVDLMQRILANLDQEQRVKTVPLVCRAWRDAAQAPSIMWERVRLSLAALGAAQILGSEVSGEVHHPRLLAPWLAARSCSIHTLSVCILNDAAAVHMTEGLLLASLPHLPALRELHIFSTGILDRRSLSLVASLSCTHCKLQEVSLAFSPDKSFVPADLGVLERVSTLTSLSIDLHAAARHIRASSAGHPRWQAELPQGLCNLPELAELDLSFRAFQQPELYIPQAFTSLTSLKRLCLDSCGQLRCHPEVGGSLMRQLDDISLRQCRLSNLGCLDILMGLRTLRELRIEDCTSDSASDAAPWEDTMRLMPPLLELADMFNIILRRCRNSRADSDLVRAGSRLQRMLHARCNQLSALPAALSAAWHCCPSRLTLRYCGLRHLPGGQYLKTVTVLDLEGNNFRSIPVALRGAKQLSHLDLSCNHELQVGLQDVHILMQLHSLSILDLSKVSERLPLEGPALPNEVLPYWTKASLHNLAAVVCWRHAASLSPTSIRVTQSPEGDPNTDQELSSAFSCLRTPERVVPLEVSVMLLGAPWLSSSCIKYASIKEAGKITFDMDATCDAYIKTILNIMSPGARQAMSRKARQAASWRRLTWAEFKGGVSSFFSQLMHRMRLHQR